MKENIVDEWNLIQLEFMVKNFEVGRKTEQSEKDYWQRITHLENEDDKVYYIQRYIDLCYLYGCQGRNQKLTLLGF